MTDTDRYLDQIADDEADRSDDARATREDGDQRSDLEQEVEARSDAVKRGEGGEEPEPMTAPGDYSGNAGTGGEVKNQDVDAQ